METPQLVDKIPLVMDMTLKEKQKKKIFFAAYAIGNRQHDDVQNERSLGTYLGNKSVFSYTNTKNPTKISSCNM